MESMAPFFLTPGKVNLIFSEPNFSRGFFFITKIEESSLKIWTLGTNRPELDLIPRSCREEAERNSGHRVSQMTIHPMTRNSTILGPVEFGIVEGSLFLSLPIPRVLLPDCHG